jgi:beta-aspartyl-peptidase (threonine type)
MLVVDIIQGLKQTQFTGGNFMQLLKSRIDKFIWLLVPIFMVSIALVFTMEKEVYAKEKLEYVLAVHGGGVGIPKNKTSSKDREFFKQCKLKLTKALKIGETILKEGGSSLDAVEATIKFLEDSPLFNAGKGAVFNINGFNQLDASIMDGKTLNAGAVASVTIVKNPIMLARKVMTETKHVLLCAEGADLFAKEQGLDIVDPSYFKTASEWEYFQKSKKMVSLPLGSSFGTVGAVALDSKGNLAAATSTGGLSNKMNGRIGDSSIIGAGTYANNKTCAVSATGMGEIFIRNVAAYDISALMEYADYSLKKAAEKVIKNKIKKLKGYGGVIAIDKDGNIAMPFHLPGMKRGYVKSNGELKVSIY